MKPQPQNLSLLQFPLQFHVVVHRFRLSAGYPTTFVSSSLTGQLGWEPETFLLEPGCWIDFVHPDDRPGLEKRLGDLKQTGSARHEYRFRHRNGAYRMILSEWSLLTGIRADEEPEAVACWLDITDRLRAKAAFRRAQGRFRAAFESAPIGMAVIDTDYRYRKVNKAFCQMLGYTKSELLRLTLWDVTYPDDSERNAMLAQQALRGEIPSYKLEKRYITRDGRILWADLTGVFLREGPGDTPYWLGMVEDITERKSVDEKLRASEAALRLSREQLRALTANLISVQEQERRRISRDLHDDLNQQVALLSLELGGIQGGIPIPEGQLHARLEILEKMVGELAEGIHRIAHQLHPTIIDHLGIRTALESECDVMSEREGIAVSFEAEDVPEDLPPEVSLCLYRIAQEALRNVAKHSRSSSASVRLGRAGDAVTLCIKDSGAGFDYEGARGKGGLGLISMEERARLVNGTISVKSAEGTGTEVEVRVPRFWTAS